jgi:hypothetical protein
MILHIFKKDVRHLWPHITATLVLLAALARQDRWRSDFIPGSTEGWLNLLLPLAWACLIGLVMEEEPLVGDRNFWTTRPYRRGELLAAKALFALLVIHAPYFFASCYILALRGFSPLAYFPNLLWNQVLVAGAITFPAMALAALVRNFTHFILEVVAVCAAAIFLSGILTINQRPWLPIDSVRGVLTILVAAGVSIAILWMQYSRARLLLSRAVGVAGGVVAGAIFGYLLPQSAFAVRSTITSEHAAVTLEISPHKELPNPGWLGDRSNWRTVPLPVAFSGVPADLGYHTFRLWTEMIAPDGERLRTVTWPYSLSRDKIYFESYIARNSADEPAPEWLLLRMGRPLFERLSKSPITIRGEVGLMLYRLGQTTWLPIGIKQEVSGVGACESRVVEGMNLAESQLKIVCESPRGIQDTRIRLRRAETGEEWKSRVGAFGFMPGPRQAWLSPIERRQTVFTLTPDPRQGPGSNWLVPAGYLSTAKIAITPEDIVGYTIVRYELANISLGAYLATAPAQ